MSHDDGGSSISRLKSLASVETSSLDQAVTKIVLLPILAFFFQFAEAIRATFSVVIDPLFALGAGAAEFLDAVIGGGADVVSAGAAASAAGISVFGILGYIIGLAVVLAGAYLLGQYLTQDETSDVIPFTSTDIPLIGADEDSG